MRLILKQPAVVFENFELRIHISFGKAVCSAITRVIVYLSMLQQEMRADISASKWAVKLSVTCVFQTVGMLAHISCCNISNKEKSAKTQKMRGSSQFFL